MKLNFACGGSRWPGFINSDINGEPGVEHGDLNEFPYPYEDDSAEIVMISHGLFHTRNGDPVIADHAAVMREFHRILAPGGWLRIDDNPLRCYLDGEDVDAGEVDAELARGYPHHLRMSRQDLRDIILRDAGFARFHYVPTDMTYIPGDHETLDAIIGNRMGHVSFTVEAQK